MKRLLGAAALALAACTNNTVGDLKDGGVVDNYELSGAAPRIADCVVATLDANRHGLNVQRVRTLPDTSIEILGGDSDMATSIMWMGIFKPTGPSSTHLELTTKDFSPFMSRRSLHRQVTAIIQGCQTGA